MADCCEVCNDDRNAMVAKYFEKLKDATNIETSQEEMQVIENILFRFWQLGWLHKIDAADVRPVRRGHWIEHDFGAGDMSYECSECNEISCCRANYCPDCGADMGTEFEGCVPLDNATLEDADFSLADRIRGENE